MIPTVDYDVHGIMGIRVLGGTERDLAAVTRDLGTLEGPLQAEPDIVVRFLPELRTASMRYIDWPQTAFTEDAYFVLQWDHYKVKARIAFDQVGHKPLEILCQSGSQAVPLLMDFVQLLALEKGCVALHAAAFIYDGVAAIAPAWAHGGKTEALLAFAAHGAEYIADEWVLLAADGEAVYGIPTPISLSCADYERSAHLRSAINQYSRRTLRRLQWLHYTQTKLSRGPFGSSAAARMLRSLDDAVRRRVEIKVAPHTLFGKLGTLTAPPRKLFLMMSSQAKNISVDRLESTAAASSLSALMQHEQATLMRHYLAFLYAFPGRRCALLENSSARRAEILPRALAGLECYLVTHPLPVELGALYEAVQPAFSAGRCAAIL
jgi:hypothetical protein